MRDQQELAGMGQVAHETVEAQWTGSSNGQATTDVSTKANHICDVGLDPTYNTVGEMLDAGVNKGSPVLDIVVAQFLGACLKMFGQQESVFGTNLKGHFRFMKNMIKNHTALIVRIKTLIEGYVHKLNRAKRSLTVHNEKYEKARLEIERTDKKLAKLERSKKAKWGRIIKVKKELIEALERQYSAEKSIIRASKGLIKYESRVKGAWKRLVGEVSRMQHLYTPWNVLGEETGLDYIKENLRNLPSFDYNTFKAYIPEAIQQTKDTLQALGREDDIRLLEENEIAIRYFLSMWCNSYLRHDFPYKNFFDFCKASYEKGYKKKEKKRKKQKPETQQPEEQQLQPQQQDAAPKRKGRKKKNTQPA